MSVTLSSDDFARLEVAMQTLLSPFDHPSVNAWRLAVEKATTDLLGVERVMFWPPVEDLDMVPMAEGDESDEELEKIFIQNDRYYSPLIHGMRVWESLGCPKVANGAMLKARYPDLPDRIRRSGREPEWYELSNMVSVFDSLPRPASHEPIRQPIFTALTGYHSREGTPECGERGLALMRLLFSAFSAGVRTCLRLEEQRVSLILLLDLLAEGMLVCDRTGRVVHSNRALEQLLADDLEAERVREEMRRIVQSLVALVDRRRNFWDPKEPFIKDVRTETAAYRLRGNLAGSGLLGTDRALVVALEKITPELPSGETL